MSRIRKNKLLASKKAQEAETQFKWIFVLIAGAVIIGFFSIVVIKQKASSETSISAKLTQQLNTVLTGSKVTAGTFQEIDTPKFSVEFSCNDYYVGDISKRLNNKIVFAPEKIEGRMINTWTLEWNAPYKVANFLYITNPDIRYVFVVEESLKDLSFFEQLNTSLPVKLNRNFNILTYDEDPESEYSTLKPRAETHTRFIYLTEEKFTPKIPPLFSGREVSGLLILPIYAGTGDINNLVFLKNDGDELVVRELQDSTFTKIRYLDNPTLYGAIFSTNPDTYVCTLNKAWLQWNVMSEVISEKVLQLKELLVDTTCSKIYLRGAVENPSGIPGEIAKNTKLGYDPELNILGNYVSSLKNINNELQLRSCPLLY